MCLQITDYDGVLRDAIKYGESATRYAISEIAAGGWAITVG